MRKRRIENKRLLYLDAELRRAANKNNAPIWDRVRELLLKPKRRRVAVNLSKINRYTSDGEIVIVPGKVLSCGSLNHRVTIAALDFSVNALRKINEAGCKAVLIEDLIRLNPEGRGVKIIV